MNRLQRIALAHLFLSPLIELPGGIKKEMTDDEAAIYTAARKKDKDEREGFVALAGAEKAKADAAEAARKKAEDDKALLEATKKGEIDEVRKIASKDVQAKLDKFLGHKKVDGLTAAIASVAPSLDVSSRADILAIIGPTVQVDPDTFELRFLDATGQPRKNSDGTAVTADAGVREFLSARKHFQSAVVPAVGNGGGAGGGSGAGAPRKMTLAEYEAEVKAGKGQVLSQQIAKGTVTVE